ncbi:trypsin-like peptidase domain-containing protein [Streptomyces sp. NPDC050287]|uniref:S1C family serine protease n=1 Tax=Streptomyces sp. NPDC050287 TaxID=3365608 RepID=UPI0037930F7A
MNQGKPAEANEPAPTPDEATEVSGESGNGSARPEPTPSRTADAAPTHAGPGARAVGSDGDFELRAPHPSAASEGDYELRHPDPVIPAPAEERPVGPSAADTSGPAAERPGPLHDPDPYGTPPYGEPGPWAPAPPVQHPTTPVPPAVSDARAQPPMPASTAQTPHPVPAPAVQTPPAPPAPAMQAPPPAPAPPAPAMQAPPPAPAPPAPAIQTPPPAPASALSPQHPAPATAPCPPPPHPASAADQQPPLPTTAVTAPVTAPVTPADTPPAATPWQNYDPWAPVTAPLQQTGAAVSTKEQRRKKGRRVLVGAAVLLALVSGGVGGAVGAYLERNGGIGEVELPQVGPGPSGRAPDSVAGIAARALPSVVTLHVTGSGEQGTGTGFVLDDRGHILTNNHVVESAGADGEISVTFNSGDTAKATVVGRDSGYDLAVVKVRGVSGLVPLPLGNSDNVQVGDPVVAIGAPFDLEGTVTSGIISAKERPITAGGASDVSYVDALQTDAPINPGNSGGPLLDARARVIGINSAIRSADGGSDSEPDSGKAGSIGLGFAIPVNQGKRVAEELINTGRATHPVIGVTLDMDYTGDGARVDARSSDGGPAVTVGGPGDRAGVKAGDIITEVDGRRVHSGEELVVRTRAHRPGDRLELTLERGGEQRTISLVLGSSGG